MGIVSGGNRHSVAGRTAKRKSLGSRHLSRNGLCNFAVLLSNINWYFVRETCKFNSCWLRKPPELVRLHFEKFRLLFSLYS